MTMTYTKKATLPPTLLVLSLMVLSVGFAPAQTPSEPSQDVVNGRVANIIDHALRQGIFITPESVRATPMKAHNIA
jgi:hypothetical protein